ncbi:MAG: PAS domain S-box protein [Bacteroidetes bacterium]|nr:PAS domain S-box protein [Bacteroidota bacterium]
MTTIDDKSKMKILRQKAEELLKNNLSKISAQLPEAETSKLLHELEVYQIELELQNEDLKQANAIARERADKYTELYDFAPSGYFTLSNEGEIIEINLTASQLLGKDRSSLVGSMFHFFVSQDTRPVFNEFLEKVFTSKQKESCELTLSTNNNQLVHTYHTAIVSENREQCFLTMVDITESSLSINTLLKKEKQYQELIDSAKVGISREDINGKLIYYNHWYAELFGYTEEEMKSHSISTLVYHEDVERVMKYHNDRIAGKHVVSKYDFRGITKDGSIVYLEVDANPIFDNNKIIGTNSYIWDITNRKKAELALNESEEKFRSIFECATDGLMVTDKKLKIIDVNPAFIKITGIPRKSLVGQSGIEIAKKFVNARQLPQIMKLLKIYITGKQVPPYELNYKDKILEIHSQKQENNQLIGIIRDITDKKRALEVLQERDIYNRGLLETLPLGLALASMDGILVDVNTAFAEIIGRTEDECKKLTYWDITPKTYDEQEQQQLDSLNKTGKYGPYEKEYIHKKGHLVPVRLQGKIIEHDGTKYIWSSVENITERKQTEKKIQRKIRIDEAFTSLYTHLISPDSSMEDIAILVKKQALELTESTQCYVGTIDPENGDLVAHSNTEMMENKQCSILQSEDQRIAFPMGMDGTYGRLWGVSLNQRKAFYTNDVENHSASKGVPEGHLKLKKFLSVPVMLQQELVGQISLANPSRDFNDSDINTIMKLAEFYAMSIRKQRYVDDLKTRSIELEGFNESMIDREMRIIELKEEINNLCDEFNKPRRFETFWNQKDN